ncbi:MAG: arginase family protein [Solirubrobacteraceae bacterium]
MTASIAVIGAPTSAGAFAPGQEDAPAALRAAGIVGALGASDRGDTPRFRWRVDHHEPHAMNAEAVVDGVRAVAAMVEEALGAGELPVVLGGDCTVGVGTVAGAVAAGTEPRLVYLDLHPDLNTPQSVPDGALDWTGVAHMLDVEGADERLAGAGPRRPLLVDEDLVLLGTGPEQCTAAERAAIAARDLRPIGVDALRADPAAAARAALERAAAGGRRFLVHFDVDVIDFSDVALSENTGRGVGVGFEAAVAALGVLLAHDALLGLTVTELNPHHGAQDGTDVARLARALAGALRPL